MSKAYLVVINGSGGQGKDTFVDAVKFATSYTDIDVFNLSTIDPVKEGGKYVGYDDSRKDEIDRAYLQESKALAKKYYDYPMPYLYKEVKECIQISNRTPIIFIHCREPEEIQEIVEKFTVFRGIDVPKTLLVKNPRVAQITSNPSDARVEEFSYDYIVRNDGDIKDLIESAREFLDVLLD